MTGFEGMEPGAPPGTALDSTALREEIWALQDGGRTQLVPVQQVESTGSGSGAAAGDGNQQAVTRAETLLSQTLNQYRSEAEKGKDPAALLTELGPRFQAAIKVADDNYSRTLKQTEDTLKKLRPQIKAAGQQLKTAQDNVSGILSKVTARDREEIAAAAEEYHNFDAMAAEKNQIAGILKPVPGLLDAADALQKASAARAALNLKPGAAADQLKQADKALDDAIASVNKIVDTLPESNRKEAARLVVEYASLDASDAHKADLLSTLKGYPDVLASLDSLKAVESSMQPLVARIEPLQAGMLNALIDCLETRKVYGEALSAGGDQEQAKLFLTEAELLAQKIAAGDVLPHDPVPAAPEPGRDRNIRLI